MNSNKTQCILFATPNFNKRTETFQITIDDTVRHMEDKVKNLGVIVNSRLSFEHHIKSLCSRLNGTLSYLNRVTNTLDQTSKILLINSHIFSHLNYCSAIWSICSEIYAIPAICTPYYQSRPNLVSEILPCEHTHLFGMRCHCYILVGIIYLRVLTYVCRHCNIKCF